MPKISIITPCYNSAEYLERLLESLQAQSFGDFEAVFVDDNSSDDTVSVLRKLTVKYGICSIILENKENLGPSLTRKRGIENSAGDYVAFLDSDDWLESDFLKEMYDAVGYGKKDIAFCNYRLVYDSGKIVQKDMIGDTERFKSTNDVLTVDVDGLCAGIFRKKLFDCFVFPNIRNGEDMAVIPILISRAVSVGFSKKSVYNYYQRKGSLSTEKRESIVTSLCESFDYIYQNLDNERFYEQMEYLGIRNLLYGALLGLFKQGLKVRQAQGIVKSFEEKFPNWQKNPYISGMPLYKRIFTNFVKLRWFVMLYFMSQAHIVLTR